MREVLVPFIVFATTFGIVFTAIRMQQKVRLAMIEKGMDPQVAPPRKRSFAQFFYYIACLAIGVGLGVYLGLWIKYGCKLQDEAVFAASIFALGGLGLLCGIITYRKYFEKNNEA
ncbi:MAG: hypothetical protein ORN85_04005 [Sediminibacterium sp.]|nr:hypothetical protein [Sediminibacterium sp.]